ncbi:hypothetical protein DFS34DRAFT_499520, partial [Phlyctochytrium arcticum]
MSRIHAKRSGSRSNSYDPPPPPYKHPSPRSRSSSNSAAASSTTSTTPRHASPLPPSSSSKPLVHSTMTTRSPTPASAAATFTAQEQVLPSSRHTREFKTLEILTRVTTTATPYPTPPSSVPSLPILPFSSSSFSESTTVTLHPTTTVPFPSTITLSHDEYGRESDSATDSPITTTIATETAIPPSSTTLAVYEGLDVKIPEKSQSHDVPSSTVKVNESSSPESTAEQQQKSPPPAESTSDADIFTVAHADDEPTRTTVVVEETAVPTNDMGQKRMPAAPPELTAAAEPDVGNQQDSSQEPTWTTTLEETAVPTNDMGQQRRPAPQPSQPPSTTAWKIQRLPSSEEGQPEEMPQPTQTPVASEGPIISGGYFPTDSETASPPSSTPVVGNENEGTQEKEQRKGESDDRDYPPATPEPTGTETFGGFLPPGTKLPSESSPSTFTPLPATNSKFNKKAPPQPSTTEPPIPTGGFLPPSRPTTPVPTEEVPGPIVGAAPPSAPQPSEPSAPRPQFTILTEPGDVVEEDMPVDQADEEMSSAQNLPPPDVPTSPRARIPSRPQVSSTPLPESDTGDEVPDPVDDGSALPEPTVRPFIRIATKQGDQGASPGDVVTTSMENEGTAEAQPTPTTVTPTSQTPTMFASSAWKKLKDLIVSFSGTGGSKDKAKEGVTAPGDPPTTLGPDGTTPVAGIVPTQFGPGSTPASTPIAGSPFVIPLPGFGSPIAAPPAQDGAAVPALQQTGGGLGPISLNRAPVDVGTGNGGPGDVFNGDVFGVGSGGGSGNGNGGGSNNAGDGNPGLVPPRPINNNGPQFGAPTSPNNPNNPAVPNTPSNQSSSSKSWSPMMGMAGLALVFVVAVVAVVGYKKRQRVGPAPSKKEQRRKGGNDMPPITEEEGNVSMWSSGQRTSISAQSAITELES